MSEDGSVLAQAEIDALFRQATGTNIVRPAAAAPVVTAPVVMPPPVSPPPVAHAKPAPVVTQVKTQDAAPEPPRVKVLNEHRAPARVDTGEIETFIAEQQDQLDVLVLKVAKLEAALNAVSHSISRTSSKQPGVAPAQLNELHSTLRKVVKQQANIQKGLDGTPAYNLADEFTCSECGSHGHLSIPVTCTACNTEGWWGWWPKDGE